MQYPHRGAELGAGPQPELTALDDGGGIDGALLGFLCHQHTRRVRDLPARIQPVARENRERGHDQGSCTHAAGS